MEDIFDYLDNKGLSLSCLFESIDDASTEEILNIINDVSGLIPDKASTIVSPFQFVANSSLAGDKNPCSAPACRFENVSALAKVAALYSEKILIPRPFDSMEEFDESDINDQVKEDVAIRIAILFYLKPLLMAGLVGFVSNTHYCMDCYSKQLGDVSGEYKDKFKNIREYLIELYSKNIKYTMRNNDGHSYIDVEGPDELIEHKHLQIHLRPEAPILKLLSSKSKHILSPAESKEYHVSSDFAGVIMSDLVVHNWHAVRDSANYITNRVIDEGVFRKVRNSSENTQNDNINKALSHSLPMIDGASLDNLIKLRKNEGESFQVYRDALASTLDNKHLSVHDLQSAFNDVVRPEINKIDLSIKNSKKLLKDNIRQDIVLGTGFVSLGLFSGFLPPNIGELVAALGGFQYASDLVGKVNTLEKEPDNIANERFYFLWKANKASNKKLL